VADNYIVSTANGEEFTHRHDGAPLNVGNIFTPPDRGPFKVVEVEKNLASAETAVFGLSRSATSD
jgi:hypothetical protein